MNEAAERAPVGDLGVVLERLRPRIHRILARYRIPVQDAEDLVQTSLMLAVMKWAEIAMPDLWLLGTLQNRCIMYWRGRRREFARQVPLDIRAELLPEDAPTGQQQQEQRLLLGELARHLSPSYRKVLVLRYQLGMGDEEIAAATGYSPRSITKTSHRAVELLRRAAEAQPPGGPQAIVTAARQPPFPALVTLQAGSTVSAWNAANAEARVAAVRVTVLTVAAFVAVLMPPRAASETSTGDRRPLSSVPGAGFPAIARQPPADAVYQVVADVASAVSHSRSVSPSRATRTLASRNAATALRVPS